MTCVACGYQPTEKERRDQPYACAKYKHGIVEAFFSEKLQALRTRRYQDVFHGAGSIVVGLFSPSPAVVNLERIYQ